MLSWVDDDSETDGDSGGVKLLLVKQEIANIDGTSSWLRRVSTSMAPGTPALFL
jgi:hypothetical protein